jgi:hypothetical protein
VRQLLTEGFLIAGRRRGRVILAALATNWLISSMVALLPFSLNFDAGRICGCSAQPFSVLATIFFALGPALKTVRLDLNTELKQGAGDVHSPCCGLLATRNLLVIVQVALSLCLLVTAGLAGCA